MTNRDVTLIQPHGSTRGLGLREVWTYRDLLYFLAWRDLKVRYKQTVLGAAWAILQPLALMGVFVLVFHKVGRISTDGMPPAVFYYSGVVPWTFFASAVQQGSNSLLINQSLITKVFFPRLLIPLAAVLVPLVDMAVSCLLLGGLMVYHGVTPTASIVWLPLWLLFGVATAIAITVGLAAMNVQFRDVRHAVPFLIQVGLFLSPVAYPVSAIPERWRLLYGLNPMSGVIEGFRWSVTGFGHPPGSELVLSTGVTLVLLLLGVGYFRRVERSFADVI